MSQLCRVGNCEGDPAAKGAARGYCISHYKRFLRYGDPAAGGPIRQPGRRCSRLGCFEPHHGRGLCSKHWQQAYKGIERECRGGCGASLFDEPHSVRYCDACSTVRTKIYYKRGNLRRYGLTVESWWAILEDQDWRCPICGIHGGVDDEWHIDHDHQCCPKGRSCGACLRAVLCRECNILHAASWERLRDNGLERFLSDKAIAYLLRRLSAATDVALSA